MELHRCQSQRCRDRRQLAPGGSPDLFARPGYRTERSQFRRPRGQRILPSLRTPRAGRAESDDVRHDERDFHPCLRRGAESSRAHGDLRSGHPLSQWRKSRRAQLRCGVDRPDHPAAPRQVAGTENRRGDAAVRNRKRGALIGWIATSLLAWPVAAMGAEPIYQDLVARAEAGDATLDYTALRLSYARSDSYDPYARETADLFSAAWNAFQAKDCVTVLAKTQALLKINYVSIPMHMVRSDCLAQSGDK